MGVKTSYSIFVFTFISILVGINTTNRKIKAPFYRMIDDHITGHSNWDTVEGLQQSLAMLCFTFY